MCQDSVTYRLCIVLLPTHSRVNTLDKVVRGVCLDRTTDNSKMRGWWFTLLIDRANCYGYIGSL